MIHTTQWENILKAEKFSATRMWGNCSRSILGNMTILENNAIVM